MGTGHTHPARSGAETAAPAQYGHRPTAGARWAPRPARGGADLVAQRPIPARCLRSYAPGVLVLPALKTRHSQSRFPPPEGPGVQIAAPSRPGAQCAARGAVVRVI